MSDPNVLETIGALKAQVKAAHDRVDRLELRVVKELEKVGDKLDSIQAWMHKKQGSEMTWIFVGSLAGAVLTFLANKYLGG